MKKNIFIDQMDIIDGLSMMVNDHKKAIKAVESNIIIIREIVEKIVCKLIENNTSRLIYCGAGTSGRIGVQDGVELYPTFSWPRKRVCFLLAGGIASLTRSIENAEDNISDAIYQVKKNLINENDIVFGIAASSNTPFTCKVLEESNKKGALTVAIGNRSKGEIFNHAKFKILLNTGEEVIQGSTRLKAGTSQKICLNLISTMVMIKLNKVKKGRMIYVVPTNKKLRKRKNNIDLFFKNNL